MSSGLRAPLLRLIALLCGVLLLLLGLAPYGFGLQAQTIMTTLAEQLAQVWHLPVLLTAYQRGWFSSTAEMQLPVSAALHDVWRTYIATTAETQDEATVSIAHRVLHGPFPLSHAPHSIGRLTPVQALVQSTVRSASPAPTPGAPASPASATPPVLHVNTVVFLHGASQSRVFIPAFVAPARSPSATFLVWNGLRGEVSVDRYAQYLRSALRLPGLYLKRAETQVSLQNVLLRVEARSESLQAQDGQLSMHLDTLDIGQEGEAQAEWAIQKGELRTAVALAGETLRADIDVRCATCRLAMVDANQGMAHLAARRLSMPALLRLGHEVARLWPDEPDMRSLWRRLLLSGELTPILATLARTSPTLALTEARLHTPDGAVLLSAHMQLHHAPEFTAEHLPLVLQNLDAEAMLEAPVVWVKAVAVTWAVHLIRKHSGFASFLSPRSLRFMATIAVDKYLQHLLERAYLIQEGPLYKSRARYSKGQLLLNGQAVPWPALAP